ncbi:glycosyltransferase [Cellulomonas sp. CW35]|uniref:glycosyltransferase n=1 Tax=Cellulomonas sp. CW35 TaxID=3458249 RepID=UPI004034E852
MNSTRPPHDPAAHPATTPDPTTGPGAPAVDLGAAASAATPTSSTPTTSSTTTSSIPTTTSVTAVLVTRGRTPYLAATLDALAGQSRRPSRVLVVDVAPRTDDPQGPLPLTVERAFAVAASAHTGPLPQVRVLQAPHARTFGQAVRDALASDDGARTTWLWLLHDDSAPEPTALAELARAVARAPSVVIAGAKQHTWTDPVRLLELGVRTDRSGRRMTDVEPGELDQGQHDARDDVLGVGTAGALVRRDAWDELGGPDPALGPFGDGLDLSRRARLAGHRVVVVPSAVVRHAQASYLGLRGTGPSGRDADGDGEDDSADPRRSFAARRRALTHQRLVTAPLVFVPVVVVLALVSAVVRSLVQVAAKQPGLAVDELRGPLEALARPAAVAAARRRARRTRRLPRRALRPLQATWRDVWRQARDRRLARREARRVVQAPSELELRELAALATRRRAGLATVAVALVAVSAVAFGPLVAAVGRGARLVGGGLLPLADGLGDLWAAATSSWVSGGLGEPGPVDPLLGALVVPTTLAGGRPSVGVALVMLGSVLLAGLGAWAAAGAATRAVTSRAWAAVVWAGAPALLLAVGDGRLGPVLAHVLLPWVALGIARAVGVQRVDLVLSGLATARRRDDERAGGRAADEGSDGEQRPDERSDERSDERADERSDDERSDDERSDDTAEDGTAAVRAPVTNATRRSRRDERAEARADRSRGTRPRPVTSADPADWVGAAARPTGSVTAAAAAALAFAGVVAGAPALLVPGVLAVLVAAACAPRHRRRVAFVVVPALVVSGPVLVEAFTRGAAGLRLLVADPGLSVATRPEGAFERLLGLPSAAGALVPQSVPDGAVTRAWPLALGAVVLGLAVLALLRGRVARGVRLGWAVAAVALAAATAVALLPVGVQDGVVAYGWTGPALSLALLGLVLAALLGADGMLARLSRYAFGWRQAGVGLVAVVALAVPVVWLAGWGVQARDGSALAVTATERTVVPAVGRQAQGSANASRVLAIARAADGAVTWQLLRADGPQLVDVAAAVETRAVAGPADAPHGAGTDAATDEVDALVARLAAGASGDVAGPLAALAVGDVLVPVLPDGLSEEGEAAADRERDALVAELDSTAGLERVTQNASGILWRVQPAAPAGGGEAVDVVTAWARTVPGGDVRDPATDAVAVPARGRSVDTRVADGDPGRLLVLAERADPHWHATLDGVPLRSVDNGWRQTFELGPQGGHLEVGHDAPQRTTWLVVQVVVLALTVLLAMPVRRRRAG